MIVLNLYKGLALMEGVIVNQLPVFEASVLCSFSKTGTRRIKFNLARHEVISRPGITMMQKTKLIFWNVLHG